MPFAAAGDVNLYYEETGTGFPIVFVHEFAADHREWESQVRWFARHYRCVTYNARGYPPSDVPPRDADYGYEYSRDDIAAVMDHLRLDQAYIVGLSMGAYATLQFGLKYPGRARALVAAGVGSGSPPALRTEFQKSTLASTELFLKDGMDKGAEQVGASPTRIQLKRKDPRGYAEFLSHLREHSAAGMAFTGRNYQAKRPSLEDFRDGFARMTLPVLLVVGDEDEPCLETNLFLKRALPGAGLLAVPNTGHAVNLEEPALFNRALGDFFAAVERGTWPARW